MSIKRSTLLHLACYMSLAISFLPIVDYYCSWYITSVPVLILLVITLSRNSNLYPLLVAIVTILLFGGLQYWIIYRSSEIVGYFINFFIQFIPFIMAVQLKRTEYDNNFFYNYLRMAAIFSGVTSFTTIIGLNIYPMASRELASGTAIYDTTRYTKINIGGFEYIYALVIFIPVLFWTINRTVGMRKAIYIAILLLDIICIYESQYTIALICMAISVIITWMMLHPRSAGGIITFSILFLLLDGFSSLGIFFCWLSENIGQEYVADRLLQVSQLFNGTRISTETSDERIMHYINDFEYFLRKPIIGHNWWHYKNKAISGHTMILDILSGAGLVGIGVLAVICQKIYSMVLKVNGKISPYVRSIWTMVIIVSILNPVIFSIIITIVFMCCLCIQKLEER